MGTISSLRPTCVGFGGASRDRTGDLLHAMQALSQLSYGPTKLRARILDSLRNLRKRFFTKIFVHQRTQLRIERDALVEHETAAFVPLPADLLEPAEDAALQLQHVVHAVLAHP